MNQLEHQGSKYYITIETFKRNIHKLIRTKSIEFCLNCNHVLLQYNPVQYDALLRSVFQNERSCHSLNWT